MTVSLICFVLDLETAANEKIEEIWQQYISYCQVYICGDVAITKKCHKKRTAKGTSASFKGLKNAGMFSVKIRFSLQI